MRYEGALGAWPSFSLLRNVKDWQLKQAEAAVKLYKEYFLEDAVPGGKHEVDIRTIHLPDCDQALDKMRQLLRLKHYSYRTEHSYLDQRGQAESVD